MSSPSLSFDTPDLAQHYEQVSADRQFKAGQILAQELKIKAGERALDVGCGTGLLADYVANLVGPSGAVVGFDPLPLRIEIAQRRARPNVSFFVGNALELKNLADASFDVIYLNAVFHWISDKPLALRNFFRVLKPGGRIGITTGDKEHTTVSRETRERVLAQAPYNRYPETSSGASQRVSTAELRQLLASAGFSPTSIESRANNSFHATASAAIEFSQASSFGNFLGHLPEELRASARAQIEQAFEKLRTPEGIPQVGARIFAIAHKQVS